MQKFMLLIREDLTKLRQFTEKQMSAEMQLMDEWTKSIADAGLLIDTEPLDLSGRYISKTTVTSDGPFIESKEGIAGYYIIQAENLEHAVSIAKRCPLVMRGEAVIELRPTPSQNR